MPVSLDEARGELSRLGEKIAGLRDALHIDALRGRVEELEASSSAPDFWDDRARSEEVLREIRRARERLDRFERLQSERESTAELLELSLQEGDEDPALEEEILASVKNLTEEAEALRLETLLTGEYDANSAILSFHPGAGGTEAQDWALMLYRMYSRWGERHGYEVKLLDYQDGEEAGIKSASLRIGGENAYGFLHSENGVHRLVRISPFDASGRRHTSFASVEVMPELPDDGTIVIRDEDIEVTTHKSSGAGGQHINKTESAVRIVHRPTGIVVGCQTERSQVQNRETALSMLRAKLAEIQLRERQEKMESIGGEKRDIEWGSQIRSYVFMPYTLVKDARTGYENPDVAAVMDGDLDGFIEAYLAWENKVE